MRVGHRGAAALAPENSLAAIEAAAAHGVEVVELDVLRRPDAALVLAHGPRLPAPGARGAWKFGRVSPALPATLPADAPSLDDALALAARLGLAVQLDVKLEGAERDVAAALRRHGLLERAFVSSFSLRTLAAFARVEPALPRSYTYPDDRFGLGGRRLLAPAVRLGLALARTALPWRLPGRLRGVGAAAATLNWTVASPRAIDACHRLGAAVFVWTVNEPRLVRDLDRAGADGIITDDPRLLAGTSEP